MFALHSKNKVSKCIMLDMKRYVAQTKLPIGALADEAIINLRSLYDAQ